MESLQLVPDRPVNAALLAYLQARRPRRAARVTTPSDPGSCMIILT